ncbi:MAG: hypothetical protein M1837_004585 [Sclerophora amabilis]|nr:MAG: hypothetical protein M1837_004585 [Sclerophora amabilis]
MTRDDASDPVALETLDLLETRLRKIEYVVGENSNQTLSKKAGRKTDSIALRLADLEHAFKELSMESEIVQDVLQLLGKDTQFPSAFRSSSPEADPTAMSTADVLSVVLSSATQYSTASSDLTVINDMPIPSAEASASLVELLPRIAQLSLTQEKQAKEVAALRQRSASLLERWYDVTILSGGECWTEWDKRMLKVERAVKRAELAKDREENQL